MSNLEEFTLPDRGFVFWPVGTGDSTTVVIDKDHVMQVDIRQMESSTVNGGAIMYLEGGSTA